MSLLAAVSLPKSFSVYSGAMMLSMAKKSKQRRESILLAASLSPPEREADFYDCLIPVVLTLGSSFRYAKSMVRDANGRMLLIFQS